MNKPAYEINLERRLDRPSERSVLDCRDNEEYWPQNICEEIM